MAHIHELIDWIVNVLIVHDDKVLLIHHKKLDKWLPIGGHIELDEDPDQALFREIQEECGLEVEILNEKPGFVSDASKPLYKPEYLDIHRIDGTHRHIGLVYFAKAKSDQFVHNTEEHHDIRWFTCGDLENLDKLPPQIKYYALVALDRVKNS
jgi:8-oxo-dGTP diphosphatase